MSDDAAGSAKAERGLEGSASEVASFEEDRRGPIWHLQAFLHQYPTSIPLIVLLIGVVIFTLAAPGKFLSPLNLSVVLQQVTIVAILGMAQTLVILTAGIDLSVGLIMILCHVVMGRTAVVFAPQIPAWILATTGIAIDPFVIVLLSFPLGLLAGLACGLLNGVLVTTL